MYQSEWRENVVFSPDVIAAAAARIANAEAPFDSRNNDQKTVKLFTQLTWFRLKWHIWKVSTIRHRIDVCVGGWGQVAPPRAHTTPEANNTLQFFSSLLSMLYIYSIV